MTKVLWQEGVLPIYGNSRESQCDRSRGGRGRKHEVKLSSKGEKGLGDVVYDAHCQPSLDIHSPLFFLLFSWPITT